MLGLGKEHRPEIGKGGQKMKGVTFVLCLVLAGCTMAPRVVKPAGPSLDNGVPNSGIIQLTPEHGAVVTPLFIERYEALIKLYGSKLIPPMTEPRWIEPSGTNYVITADGLAAFAEMDFYYRQHLTP